MVTLGDSLLAKGQLYAAQFCYIVSAAEWGTRGRGGSKLVLLGAQVEGLLPPGIVSYCLAWLLFLPPLQAGDWPLEAFATTEAIQMTEVALRTIFNLL